MEAMVGAAELQVPPGTASFNNDVWEIQTIAVPVMIPAFGSGLTVTTTEVDAEPQLLVTTYEMVVVPAATPVTIPEVPTVAILVSVLLHIPPPVRSISVVVAPGQTVYVPRIAPAVRNGLTVTTVVAIQPVDNVKVIVAVPVPGPPVTKPEPLTVAIPGALVPHVPPPASVNAVVRPTQTNVVPVIAEGNGFTVTTAVVRQPVPNA